MGLPVDNDDSVDDRSDHEESKHNLRQVGSGVLDIPVDDDDENDEDFMLGPKPAPVRINSAKLMTDVEAMLGKVEKYTSMLVTVLEEQRQKEERKKEKRRKKMQAKEKENKKSKTEKRKKSKESKAPPTKKRRLSEDPLIEKNHYLGIPHEEDAFEVKEGKKYLRGKLVFDEQPEYFTGGVMRDYQIDGYCWLKRMFDNAANGILADEMGLGKTIQCIAQVSRLVKIGYPGPFLVCGPLSTIENWFNEFKRFAPACPLMLYYGKEQERIKLMKVFRESDIMEKTTLITSYEILMRDRALLAKTEWSYLIVDEGHRLKNRACRLQAEMKRIPIQTKLILTGTPLQNNLSELWSLLNFMVPEIFSDLDVFQNFFDFDKLSEHFGEENQSNFVHILHKVLAPFLLRRTKKDVALSIPAKREMLIYAPSSIRQYDIHVELGKKCLAWKGEKKKQEKNAHLDLKLLALDRRDRCKPKKMEWKYDSGEKANNYTTSLHMDLRKSCNHPYLLEYPLIPGTDIYMVDEELIRSSGKMILMDKMIPKLLKDRHKILIFSQMTKMLDILSDYFGYRNIPFFRLDGSTKQADRQSDINSFNSPNSDVSIFLLSTRAGGLGINLTAADTVIIYDSDWNPQNDLQAQDRCHRIGQTRPVVVYRYVLKDSLDQLLVERAQAKRALGRVVINDKKFKGRIMDDLEQKVDDKEMKKLLLEVLKTTENQEKHDGLVGSIDESKLDKICNRAWVMKCEETQDVEMFKFLE